MSDELRHWLADLSANEPEAALVVGQALVALANEGPALGPPTVAKALPGGPGEDLREALDDTYQCRLEQLRSLRHAAEEAAELEAHIQARIADQQGSGPQAGPGELRGLVPGVHQAAQRLMAASQRAQADPGAFRVRKEILKARYTAQEAQDAIASLLDDPAFGLGDDDRRTDPAPATAGGDTTPLTDILAER